MNVVTRLLFYLSKTDRRLIVLCSDTAYKTQVGNGIFVLIVGILAFCSASYALRIALGAGWVAYVIAAVYSALIMLIDREIVSATSKKGGMIATRLVMAVFIGLVVSVPLELRIFEKQIDQELKRLQNNNNSSYLAKKEQAETQYQGNIQTMEQRVQELEKEASELQDRLTNELLDQGRQIQGVTAGTGRPGVGPVYRRLEDQIKEKNKQLEQANDKLSELKNNKAKELERIEKGYEDLKIPEADDLLSRYIALGAVKQHPQQGWDAWTMAWGVRFLLIMLEITPALIKILQEENEYDALIQAMRRRSITRVYAIANDHMEQLTQNGGQNPTPTLLGQLKTDPLTS